MNKSVYSAGRIKILIVDDDQEILEQYNRTLSSDHNTQSRKIDELEKRLFGDSVENSVYQSDFDLTLASQGLEAIDLIEQSLLNKNPFSIVYIDVHMPPGISGIETAKRIRALDEDINIAIVSGFSEIEPSEISQLIPPPDKLFYFQKPIHPREIQQFSIALGAKWSAESEIKRIQKRLVSTIAERTVQLNESKSNYERLYRRYRTLYHENPSMFFTIDFDGNILSVNDFGATALGYAFKSLIHVHFASLHDTDDAELVEQLIRGSIDHPDRVHRQEVRLCHAKGGVIWVRESVRLVDKSPDEHNLLIVCEDITDRIEKEEEASKLNKENRFLLQKSLAIQEEERKNLAREIHDELGQSLTAIQADAEFIRKHGGKNDNDAVSKSALAILELTSQIYHTAHSIMERLRPTALDGFGLDHALNEAIDNWRFRYPGVNLVLSIDGDLMQLAEEHEIQIYRIVQESLTNISRHAKASEVRIEIVINDKKDVNGEKKLHMLIKDNGVGFQAKKRKKGLGLIGIRERVNSLRGEFETNSSPENGVELKITIPLNGNKGAKK